MVYRDETDEVFVLVFHSLWQSEKGVRILERGYWDESCQGMKEVRDLGIKYGF